MIPASTSALERAASPALTLKPFNSVPYPWCSSSCCSFSFFPFLLLFFHIFQIVFKIQLSPFLPHHSTHTSCPHFPPLILPPLVLSKCPLYMFLTTLPPFSPLSPLTSPLVTYCQIVRNFNVSGCCSFDGT